MLILKEDFQVGWRRMQVFLLCGFLLLSTIISVIATGQQNASCSDGAASNATAVPIGDLSWKLYEKIVAANAEKNIVFSPASIVLALALVELGATGETRNQLKTALQSAREEPNVVEQMYQSLQKNLRVFTREGTVGTLRVANGIWHGNQLVLKDEFKTKATQCFGSNVASADFVNNPDRSRQNINSWVSNVTMGKIAELIKPRIFTPATTVVLVNALYFKAAWEKVYRTENRHFYALAQAQAQSVKFMIETGQYLYNSNDMAEILGIPYKDVPMIMYIIKPKDNSTGIESIESRLNSNNLRTLARGAMFRKVAFEIPAFSVRTPTDLTAILKQIGMDKMFDGGLNRMLDGSHEVDAVVHEAFIKVNENGTEAAAATAVLIADRSSIVYPPEQPIPFVANRPFMFCLVHNPTRTNLFLGKVNKIEDLD